jgi:hypothetical protein
MRSSRMSCQTADCVPAFCSYFLNVSSVHRNSSVGTATRYGLVGPWIESRWGRDFPHTSRPALGPPIQWVPGLSRGVALTTHPVSNAEVKARVELYIYSPCGSSWPVLGWRLPELYGMRAEQTQSDSISRLTERKCKVTFFTVQRHLFLISALDGGGWSASRLGRFTLRKTASVSHNTHWIRGWVGPRAGLDVLIKTIGFASLEIPTQIFQPAT